MDCDASFAAQLGAQSTVIAPLDFHALRRELAHEADASAQRVVSLNVGPIRTIEWEGERVATGIFKAPVSGPVALRGVNFTGDDQADRSVHGGRDKAVYAYAVEDYEFWHDEFDIAVVPGLFGENLTVLGRSLTDAVVGERWRVGSVELEVAQPRLPCYKLGLRMGDPQFPRAFLAAGRPGAYFRIVTEGEVAAGDAITVVSRPAGGVTLGEMLAALIDRSKARALLRAPELPAFWRRIAESGETHD